MQIIDLQLQMAFPPTIKLLFSCINIKKLIIITRQKLFVPAAKCNNYELVGLTCGCTINSK